MLRVKIIRSYQYKPNTEHHHSPSDHLLFVIIFAFDVLWFFLIKLDESTVPQRETIFSIFNVGKNNPLLNRANTILKPLLFFNKALSKARALEDPSQANHGKKILKFHHLNYDSALILARIWFTIPGLALPFESFITFPTKKP